MRDARDRQRSGRVQHQRGVDPRKRVRKHPGSSVGGMQDCGGWGGHAAGGGDDAGAGASAWAGCASWPTRRRLVHVSRRCPRRTGIQSMARTPICVTTSAPTHSSSPKPSSAHPSSAYRRSAHPGPGQLPARRPSYLRGDPATCAATMSTRATAISAQENWMTARGEPGGPSADNGPSAIQSMVGRRGGAGKMVGGGGGRDDGRGVGSWAGPVGCGPSGAGPSGAGPSTLRRGTPRAAPRPRQSLRLPRPGCG